MLKAGGKVRQKNNKPGPSDGASDILRKSSDNIPTRREISNIYERCVCCVQGKVQQQQQQQQHKKI